jgi:lysophospholipase L1-like esterase
MTARGRLVSGLVTMVIALAGFVTVGALHAAATPGTVQYVALGDSYAAGRATGSYPDCPHSPDGYPALLDSEKRIHLQANATCSGAETSDVADTQLSALNPGTRLVTLTVGGNDLGVSLVASACTTPGMEAKCLAAIQEARDGLPTLGSDLVDLYADVADAAPRARIVVTGYPRLFEPAPGAPNAAIIDLINESTDALNRTIQQAVAAAYASGVNIVYVDVTAAFEEHGIGGSKKPFINASGVDAFHPNAAGYRAYADAIFAAPPGAWVDKQKHLV